MRLDAPHEACVASFQSAEKSPPLASASLGDEPPSEQLHIQAAQLAAHLRARQRELDEREAALNSQVARWESEVRSARLWLELRQGELSAGGEELAAERERLALRAAEIERREKDCGCREEECQRRQEELCALEQSSRERERELRVQLDRLAAAEAARLRDEQSMSARRAAAECSTAAAEQAAAELRREKAELERQRQTLQRRSEHVERCRAALEQLRDELGRMHRETLEIRLATEELWTQLSGAAPPAALVRSLSAIRSRLADQYRQANAELAEKKKELEAARAEIAREHAALKEYKKQYEQWFTATDEDRRRQAERLMAREEQLRHDAARLGEQARQWHAQRLDYQRELRRLRARVQRGKTPAGSNKKPTGCGPWA